MIYCRVCRTGTADGGKTCTRCGRAFEDVPPIPAHKILPRRVEELDGWAPERVRDTLGAPDLILYHDGRPRWIYHDVYPRPPDSYPDRLPWPENWHLEIGTRWFRTCVTKAYAIPFGMVVD